MLKTQTKIIVRNLPKCMTKEEFLKEVSNDKYMLNYIRFCESNKYNKSSSARAYINFYNEDSMYEFKEQFESRPFVDETGNEAYCTIEFAVCQKVPGKSKVDSKQNTISSDMEFIKFTEELKEPPKHVTIGNVESNLEEIKNKESDKSNIKTPLIEYLSNIPKKERAKKEDYRRKVDFNKSFNKKDIENNVEIKPVKTGIKTIKKNSNKDVQNEPVLLNKFDSAKSKNGEKLELKKSKPVSQRNDIKTYAAAYEEFEYEPWEKRGFENKIYRGNRMGGYDGEDKSSYYYPSRNPDPYYRGYGYGYSEYQSYGRPTSQNKTSKRCGGRRPPAYSATRKD